MACPHSLSRHFSVFALCALLLAGCGSSGGDASPGVTLEPEPGAAALVDAAGDRAAIVFLIRTEAWAAAHGHLTALAGKLPRALSRALPELAEPGPLVGALTEGVMSLPGEALAALDGERPMVIALGEPPAEGPPGFVASQSPLIGLEGTRTRIILPATDVQKMVESITQGLNGHHEGREIAGTPHWRVEGKGFVALSPGKDHVQLVVMRHGPQTWEARSQRGSIVTPAGSAAPRTPALVHATRTGAPLAVLFRPWRVRAFGAWEGSLMAGEALEMVSPEHKGTLESKARSLVLLSELVIDDDGADFDEHVATLDVAATGLRAQVVSALTPDGAARLSVSAASAPSIKPDVKPVLTLRYHLDMKGLLAKAAPLGVFSDEVPRVRDLLSINRECGWSCAAHVTLRHPTGLFKSIFGAMKGQGVTPQAAVGVMMSPTGRVPRGAMAVQVSDAEITRIKGLVREREITFAEASLGGQPWLMIGIGMDPKAAFDFDTPTPGAALISLEGVSGNLTIPGDAELPAVFQLLMQAQADPRLVTRRHGRVLETTLTLGWPADADNAAEVAALGKAGWGQSPIRAFAASPASRCLTRAGMGLYEGLNATASAPPEMRTQLVMRALAEIKGDLDCARGDAAVAEVANGLEGAMLKPALDGLLADMNLGAIREILSRHCPEGAAEPAWCAGWAAKVAPFTEQITRPASTHTCDTGGARAREADARLLWSGGRVFLDESPIEVEALPAALAAALRPDPLEPMPGLHPTGEAERHGIVQLWISGEATYGQVRPLLEIIDAANALRVSLVARAPEGHTMKIPLLAQRDPERPGHGLGFDAPPPPPSILVRHTGADKEPATIRAEHPDDTLQMLVTDDAPWASVVSHAAAACPEVQLVNGLPERPKAGLAVGKKSEPPRIKVGEPTVGPAMSKEVIQRVIRRHRNRFRYCYEKELSRDPKLAGKSVLSFTISPEGRVGEVSAHGMPKLEACMTRAAEAMRFPKPIGGGVVKISYPFIFSPAEGSEAQATPTPQKTPEAGDGARGSIQKIMMQGRADFQRCYEGALMKNPSLAGRVKLKLTVRPDGSTTGVEASGMDEIKECMEEKARGLKFSPPADGREMHISYPFIFSPG